MGDSGDLVFAFLLPLLTTSRHLVFFNLGLFPPSNSSRPGVPTSSTGMISPGNNHRPITPPRTLVLCFDGTGNQFDAVVRHGTNLAISCAARLPPLVEHEYCPILHYPGEGQQGPADGLLPGTSDTCWYHRYCTASRTSF